MLSLIEDDARKIEEKLLAFAFGVICCVEWHRK